MPTAAEVGLQSLFRYQAFNFERLSRLIQNHQFHFSSPGQFNDPWDCQPHYNPNQLDDPATRERTVEAFIRIDRELNRLSEAEHRRREQRLRTDLPFLKSLLLGMSELGEHLNQQYRILCLAEKADVPLMWSHYARGHSGLCLELTVQNPIICAALQVEYHDKFPDYQLDPLEPSDRDHLLPLLAKSSDWAYEREYRVIAMERAHATSSSLLIADKGLVTIPSGTIKSVICGCLMPEKDRRQIEALIAQSDSRIILNEAIRVPDRYQVEIRPLTLGG